MRTLILGIGAQKSGTTWLFKQLLKSKNFKPGLVKEYQLFNVLFENVINEQSDAIEKIPLRVKNSPFIKNTKQNLDAQNLLKSFYQNYQNYFNYIDGILNDENSFTTDITPSYALLPVEAFYLIQNELKKRDIGLKVVYFMREPVTRAESAIKMHFRRQGVLDKISNKEVLPELVKNLSNIALLNRGNYKSTCARLESVISAENIFYGFYETLFSKSEMSRLAEFLSVDKKTFDIEQKINKSGYRFKYKSRDIKKLKELTSEQYQFVQSKFGFDIALWHQACDKIIDQSWFDKIISKNKFL